MRGDAGEDGRDANLCEHCLGPKPERTGTKPRKYCSRKCCRAAAKQRSRRPPTCRDCGVLITPRPGRGKQRQRCEECRAVHDRTVLSARRDRGKCEKSCSVCGVTFCGDVSRRFCSTACRYSGAKSGKNSPPAICITCGGAFRRKYKNQARCSRACRGGRVIKCLNCSMLFRRTRRNTGSYSVQKKYCTRECAFEARRRRLPDAIDTRRSDGLTQRIASWFLSWGDDVYPIARRCESCGRRTWQYKNGPEIASRCRHCRESRTCRYCDNVAGRYRGHCDACIDKADEDKKKSTRKSRRLAKSRYGNNRKRCRRYGVPYENVRATDVYERDGWRCQICGCELLRRWERGNPRSRTIDHIIPLSAGPGSPGHVISNLQAACWLCNVNKGNSVAAQDSNTLH